MSITFTHQKIEVGICNVKLSFPECLQKREVDAMVGEGTGLAYYQSLGVIRKRHPDAWMICKVNGGSAVVRNPLPADPQTAERLIEVLHEHREELATSHFFAHDADQLACEIAKTEGRWYWLPR